MAPVDVREEIYDEAQSSRTAERLSEKMFNELEIHRSGPPIIPESIKQALTGHKNRASECINTPPEDLCIVDA